MKITFSIIVLFVLFQGSAQQASLSVPVGTLFHDAPDNTFLTLLFENGKTYLKEIDESHQVVWEDSIEFLYGSNDVELNGIRTFPGTNQHLVFMRRPLTFNGFSSYDTCIFQFSLVDLSLHTINSIADTFAADGVWTLPIDDTSMYLFMNSYDGLPNPYYAETYRINNNLDTFFIADKDSVQKYLNISRYAFYNDTVCRYDYYSDSNWPDTLYAAINTLDMTNISDPGIIYGTYLNTYVLPSQFYWTYPYILQQLHGDSILGIFEGSSSGVALRKWYSILFNYKLEEKHYFEMNAPSEIEPSTWTTLYYKITTYGAKVHHDTVYLLANAGNIGGPEVYQSLFVYDLTLNNLICKIPIYSYPWLNWNNRIEILNDHPYFIRDQGGITELFEIQNCNLVGIEENALIVQKELVKIVDLMGRETEFKANTVLIYIYSDGTTEKVFRVMH